MTVGTSTSASALEGVQLDDVGASTWFKPEKFSESSQTKEDVHKYVDELRLYVPQGKIKVSAKSLTASRSRAREMPPSSANESGHLAGGARRPLVQAEAGVGGSYQQGL